MQNDGSLDNKKFPVSNTGTQSSQQSHSDVKGEEQNLKAAESITGRLEVYYMYIYIYIYKYRNHNLTSTCVPKFFRKIPPHLPIVH